MFLDIIVFAGALLLGLLTYWRESRSNGIFRTYNAFINKKETRIEAGDRKGFFFQRSLVYRLLNALLVAALFGIIIYYIPLVSLQLEYVAAFFVGFVAGTYIAAALPTVKRAVDNPLNALEDIGKAGREIVSDLSEAAGEKLKDTKTDKPTEKTEEKPSSTEEEPKKETARERMKRKGYLK